MSISILDIFSIGIGPSSSHTVGPMRAANDFLGRLQSTQDKFNNVVAIKVALYGSLALTGKGHKTDTAILLGLLGEVPETVNSETVVEKTQAIINHKILCLDNKKTIPFNIDADLIFHYDKFLSKHANGLCFTALDKDQKIIQEETYFSLGGGFIVNDKDTDEPNINKDNPTSPYPFKTAKQLLHTCRVNNLTIAELMFRK